MKKSLNQVTPEINESSENFSMDQLQRFITHLLENENLAPEAQDVVKNFVSDFEKYTAE